VLAGQQRGRRAQLQAHTSFSSATSLPSKRSGMRGPVQRMVPVPPQVWQLTSSPSRATRAPSIEMALEAEVTTPSAVVRAPRVM
jgi:hypothetical protein